MVRSLSLVLAVVLIIGELAPRASASPMDLDHAANGGPTPFTTLTDDVPTPWEVYLQPAVTYSTVNRRWWFAESGLNNHSGLAFGHILKAGELKTGRPYWIGLPPAT